MLDEATVTPGTRRVRNQAIRDKLTRILESASFAVELLAPCSFLCGVLLVTGLHICHWTECNLLPDHEAPAPALDIDPRLLPL